MGAIASVLTRVELDISRIITINSVRVGSILVSNGSATDVVVTFIDNDSVEKVSIAVLVGMSFSWDVPFMADNGLTVSADTASADVVVTIAHSAIGA